MSALLDNAIAKVNRPEMAPIETPNAMQLIQSAIAQGSSIDTIERLAKLQREMVEYDAKVAFDEAMQRTQDGMKPVAAKLENTQTKSKYASYTAMDRQMRPIYSREGFSVSFNTAEAPLPDMVRVLAYVSHKRGYTRTYQIDMPADGKGAKGGDVMTKTHATGAATSYGMRYLLKMIFNVAVGEDDDDGNLGGHLDEKQFSAACDEIQNAPNLEALSKAYRDGIKMALEAGDKQAVTSLMDKRAQRKAELNENN